MYWFKTVVRDGKYGAFDLYRNFSAEKAMLEMVSPWSCFKSMSTKRDLRVRELAILCLVRAILDRARLSPTDRAFHSCLRRGSVPAMASPSGPKPTREALREARCEALRRRSVSPSW